MTAAGVLPAMQAFAQHGHNETTAAPVLETPAAPIGETRAAPESDTTQAQMRASSWAPEDGRLMLQWRPRFSYIEQANKPNRAEAVNARLLLGYRLGPIDDFGLTVQLVNVSWLEPKRATNQPGDRLSRYPLVGDPDITDWNALHLDYSGLADTRVRLGRQPIALDNERFVGTADVRQLPMMFDAVSVRNSSVPDLELFGAQVWAVRTFFGDRYSSNTQLLNARWQSALGPVAGAYAYFQDQPRIQIQSTFADNSNRIMGARLEGTIARSQALRWYYAAEVARQRPHADGDRRIRAGYHRLAIGPSYGACTLLFNYERLGSNNGLYGMQMPLSFNTLQGWAYEFFNTPRQGLRDRNVAAAADFGLLNVRVKFHRFKADFGGLDYGREWDFALTYRLSPSLSARLVYADYQRASIATARPDAVRAYAQLQYDY